MPQAQEAVAQREILLRLRRPDRQAIGATRILNILGFVRNPLRLAHTGRYIMRIMTSQANHYGVSGPSRVAPIARLSECQRHKRPWHNVETLLRLRRPDRRAIGATRQAILATLVLAIALAATTGYAAAQSQKPLTYVDILHQLTDLDRLTHLQTGCKGGLFSSWDRNSKTVWGANGDAGQYLRVEPDGEAVMMDIDGPGVGLSDLVGQPDGQDPHLSRRRRNAHLRVELPGPVRWQAAAFHQAAGLSARAGRNRPPTATCRSRSPSTSRSPPTRRMAQYYQFNYVLFPKDRPVASFRLPLNAEEQAALAAAADAWSHPGRDPKPQLPGQKTISKTITLAPGQTAVSAIARRTGVIRAIRARVHSGQRYAWRKLVLCGQWDGAAWPQILTPLGPFFGFDWETAEYGSVTSGCQKGNAYQFSPCPSASRPSFRLTNYLETPASVEFEIDWAPLPQLPDDSTYFFARWRHEPDSLTFDYPFLETAGRGHFVGVSMPIDHPLAGWWGEGDEKVWVDDDDFPPCIGTGSEDYFGDAWGIRYLSGPSFGASSMKGHRTCNYRWHFMDFIPFTKRMRMTIENYGPNGQGPRGQYDYSSTAFWYQAELTPPFERTPRRQIYRRRRSGRQARPDGIQPARFRGPQCR